jgi:hypothetical protein
MKLRPFQSLTMIALLLAGSSSVFFAGCSNEADEFINEEAATISAEPILHSNYYWYHGQQIPLTVIDANTRGLGNTWTDYTPLPDRKKKGKATTKVVETNDATLMSVSTVFYVKLYRQGDISKLNKLCKEYNVTNLGKDKTKPLWYMLECTDESYGDALEMANLFYETGWFEESVPEFIEIQE